MTTFTNVSDEDRDIPVHNLFVPAGTDFDVPDEEADGLRAQGWCTEKTTPAPSASTSAPSLSHQKPKPSRLAVDPEQGDN